jgi:hypothetical protein
MAMRENTAQIELATERVRERIVRKAGDNDPALTIKQEWWGKFPPLDG